MLTLPITFLIDCISNVLLVYMLRYIVPIISLVGLADAQNQLNILISRSDSNNTMLQNLTSKLNQISKALSTLCGNNNLQSCQPGLSMIGINEVS